MQFSTGLNKHSELELPDLAKWTLEKGVILVKQRRRAAIINKDKGKCKREA